MSAINTKKHEQVYSYLLNYIEKNQLKAEDKLPTEMEIAEKLNVSRTTIQRALRDLVTNKVAYRVQGGGTFLQGNTRDSNAVDVQRFLYIPLVVSDQKKWTGCYDYIAGAEAFLSTQSCYLTIHCTNGDKNAEKQLMDKLVNDGARCIMVLPSLENEANAFYYQHIRRGVQFVFLDALPMGIEADLVSSDNKMGGFLICEHLIEMGHRKICYVTARKNHSLEERYEGYRTALNFYDIPFDEDRQFILLNPKSSDFEEQLNLLRASPDAPTALFVSNDNLATIIISGLRKIGIKTPEDISVAGFDGAQLSKAFSPSLTTIRQPFFDIGYQAASLAFKRLNGTEASLASIRKSLPVQLVKNESVIMLPKAETSENETNFSNQ